MDTKKSDLPRLELFGLNPLLGYVVTRIAAEMRMLEEVEDLDDRLSECIEFSVLVAGGPDMAQERKCAATNEAAKLDSISLPARISIMPVSVNVQRSRSSNKF